MIGYRNAVFKPRDKCVEVYTWDEDGKRCIHTYPYIPYLYIDSANGKSTSIFGSKVSRKTFNSNYERRDFVEQNPRRKFYENVTPVQQLLLDTFWDKNEDEDFNKFPLKIYFVDIEAVSRSKYSEPKDPKDPINVITVYDSLTKIFHVWGQEPYNPKDDDVRYYHCKSEESLLTRFIDFMKKDPPDIFSGWFSEFYDLPYIANRINVVLGPDMACELSPTKRHYIREVRNEKNPEKMDDIHYIEGISCIDYYKVYKKFSNGERESYKLGYIGEYELDETKVDYGDISLYQFMKDDWDRFVDYNIQDVRLLVKLDEKLKYFEQIRSLAYLGCTTFEPALKTIAVVLGASIITARKNGKKLYTTVRQDPKSNPGGFVTEPKIGHHETIVSFDANSLYPNLMITLNMSPETKLGLFNKNKNGDIDITLSNGKLFTKKVDDFMRICKEQKWALSKSGVIFSQNKKGIYPELVDGLYKKRVKIQKEMEKIEKELYDIENKIKLHSSNLND
jgi:DNA polymerase elongation subunit (family B)